MDWATHVPLTLLRTSANTFLCLSDRGASAPQDRQHIIERTVEPNGRPSIMRFFGARGLHAADT